MKKLMGSLFISLLALNLSASDPEPGMNRKPELNKELRQNRQKIKKQKQIRKQLSMQKHAYQKATRNFARNSAGLRLIKVSRP
ncbi:MAG: hypothetical protein AB7S69_09440 [Salinivirgaceae bacterium]|jgi:hypothetical protein